MGTYPIYHCALRICRLRFLSYVHILRNEVRLDKRRWKHRPEQPLFSGNAQQVQPKLQGGQCLHGQAPL